MTQNPYSFHSHHQNLINFNFQTKLMHYPKFIMYYLIFIILYLKFKMYYLLIIILYFRENYFYFSIKILYFFTLIIKFINKID